MSPRKLAFVVVLLLFVFGCSLRSSPSHPETIVRSAFTAACKPGFRGKTEEIFSQLGKPDRTEQIRDKTYWYYDRRTFDPTSGRVDRTAQIVIQDDRILDINFFAD